MLIQTFARLGAARAMFCGCILCAGAMSHASPDPGTDRAASKAAIERMAQALRIKTVSYQDPTQIDYVPFEAFLLFLRGSYPRVFANLKVEVFSSYSLLLHWPGSDASKLPVLFDAHYDVVPIEEGTAPAWQHPPFAGVVNGGYLWGRGAIDDKLAVIAYLEALEQLLAAGYQPARSLYFSLVHDEEIGGYQGAAVIARALQARAIEFAFVVGEGGLVLQDAELLGGSDMAMIALAEKTYVTLHLRCSGEGGHASMPPRNNAAARLAAAVARIHDNPAPAKLAPPVTDMLHEIGAQRGGLEGWLMRNTWLSGWWLKRKMASDRSNNALLRNTAAITVLRSGIKENVVPQQATAAVNLRLLPGVSVDDAVTYIKQTIDDAAIEVAVHSWGEGPPVANINGNGYQQIKRAIEHIYTGAAVVPGLMVATADTRHYQVLAQDVYRFRAYRLPLSDAAAVHGTNERLSVQSFSKAIAFSAELVREVGSP
ncbi:MAG: M20/M25/M40 family metallo-hydrolase [Gammaproteobacteria bacterium]|nr:M20/M25/M40 family metallo-hydrolase [Gammaproteobacteria bacterium]